jgi:hypothetical protein
MNSDSHDLIESATINPYFFAFNEIFSRLLWDLNPESWRSRRKILSWKNKYFGKKAVIVCNGPSLLKTNLFLLNRTFTFGLNKINLFFNKSDFRPSCIVAVNKFVIEQNADFYNKSNMPLFIDSYGIKHIKARKNVVFLHSSNHNKFASDCSLSIYQGATVTFVAMQLAFHMGFKNIALIGCDHNYSIKGPAHQIVVSGEKDDNHFDPKYFSDGVNWQLPDLLHSELSYSIARDVFQRHGRKIYNATEEGNLELFPRINLINFINDIK